MFGCNTLKLLVGMDKEVWAEGIVGSVAYPLLRLTFFSGFIVPLLLRCVPNRARRYVDGDFFDILAACRINVTDELAGFLIIDFFIVT